jgi:ribonuclease R
VPAATLGNDYFAYNEAAHALVGQATGETYRLGDKVTVKLVEAIPVAGALRFELLSEGRFDAALRRRGRQGRGRRDDARPRRTRFLRRR